MLLSPTGHARQASPGVEIWPVSHSPHTGNAPGSLLVPAGHKVQWSLPTVLDTRNFTAAVSFKSPLETMFAGQVTHMVRSLDTAKLILEFGPED